jgi:hypothetical protein
MDGMYIIKDRLYRELDNLAQDSTLSFDRLKTIDLLTHSIKSIETVLAMKESGYSNRYYGTPYNDGNSYRGNRMMRDYSRDDGRSTIDRLHQMMNEAETERERDAIRRCIENMK